MSAQSIKFYSRMLAEILERTEDRKENIRLFLLHLKFRRRLGWLPKIIREAVKLLKIREREQAIIFETSRPLAPDDPVRRALEHIGAKIEVRPELIAGVVIRKGDRRIDASLSADLKELRRIFLTK